MRTVIGARDLEGSLLITWCESRGSTLYRSILSCTQFLFKSAWHSARLVGRRYFLGQIFTPAWGGVRGFVSLVCDLRKGIAWSLWSQLWRMNVITNPGWSQKYSQKLTSPHWNRTWDFQRSGAVSPSGEETRYNFSQMLLPSGALSNANETA